MLHKLIRNTRQRSKESGFQVRKTAFHWCYCDALSCQHLGLVFCVLRQTIYTYVVLLQYNQLQCQNYTAVSSYMLTGFKEPWLLSAVDAKTETKFYLSHLSKNLPQLRAIVCICLFKPFVPLWSGPILSLCPCPTAELLTAEAMMLQVHCEAA